MATRAKDINPGIVKEKRRISSSPSFPRPTNTTRKSVNTTTAPNHIKPTKSSNVDPSLKPVNTKASSSTLPKPGLDRRRSFGSRPLSQPKNLAPDANADRSPRNTSPVIRPKPRTERSRSSSSLKSPASPLAKVDTTAKKPIPVKSSRPVTKTSTTAVYKKKQPQSNASAKTAKSISSSAKRELPKKSDIIDEVDARKSDHEAETDFCQDIHDQESICSSVVDANNGNDNTEMPADMVHDDLLEQIDEEAYLLSAEASTVVSEIEQSEAELENKVKEVTEKLQQDNANNDESRSDADHANNDESKSDADNDEDANSKKDGLETEATSDADNNEDANLKKDEVETEATSDADNKEEDANSKKDVLETEAGKVSDKKTNEESSVAAVVEEEAGDDKNEKLADKEKVVEEVSGDNEQVKNETKMKMINSNPAGGSNKKESNDVIEEAASKLRVQRKNKISALIGAFETVMSSQG